MNDPIQQLQTELQNLRAEFQQEVQSLRAENQALRATLSLIATATTATTAATSLPRPVLPTPTRFDGKPYRFRTWLPTIKAKISVDGDAIGGDKAQFYFVWDNLEPAVQATVLPLLSDAEERGQWDYQEILQLLQRVYTNPNEVRDAQQALHKLRQNDGETLSAYVSRFERILYEAKGRDWPAAVKITVFRHGLNASIQRALDGQLTLPDDYIAFLQTVQRLASRSTTHSYASPINNTHPDKMDISAVEVTDAASARRARSVLPTQRSQWRTAGRCVRYGSQAHWSEDCPQLLAVINRVAAVQRSNVARRIPPPGYWYDIPGEPSDSDSDGDGAL